MKFYSIIFIFLIFLVGCSSEVPTSDILIDFSQETGSTILAYGANENDNWMDFADYDKPKEFHNELHHEYIRVWVSDQFWRESTIPLQEDGTYDFSSLDRFVTAVLESGQTPFLVIATAPSHLRVSPSTELSQPSEIVAFTDYVEQIIIHYKNSCAKKSLGYECDIEDWYIEVWNEPWQDPWWRENLLYVTLYHSVYTTIRSHLPETKIGGYSLSYLNETGEWRIQELNTRTTMDFVSLHHYGNTNDHFATDETKLARTKELFYDTPKKLRKQLDSLGKKETQIINSEYSIDYRAEYMDYLDEPFTATWYASALLWQIKSQVISQEYFYAGTTLSQTRGFGLWSNYPFQTWPTFTMKKKFTSLHPTGSELYLISSNNQTEQIEVLASSYEKKYGVTLINTQSTPQTFTLGFTGKKIKTVNKKKIQGNSIEITLQPYQVSFLELNRK